MKRLLLFVILLTAFTVINSFSADLGLVLSGQFEADQGPIGQNEAALLGKIALMPWFSVPLGEADFNVSLGISAEIADNTVFIPEIQRFEYSDRPIDSLVLRFGRIGWQDPARFTAKGRFDGFDLAFDPGKIKLGASVLYTGFLYKDTAEINISPTDTKDYTVAFDWADFPNTYAAPQRLLTAIYGEFPGLPPGRGHLYAGILAQFDLSDASERFHTQYLLLRHTLAYKLLDLILSGAIELENTNDKGVRAAYAAALEAGLLFPGAVRNRLSLAMNWASGEGTNTAAYFPLIREAQGLAFQPYFSRIMIFRANYEARFHSTFSAELGGRYFLRTDTTKTIDPELTDDSYAIGAEFYAGLLWIPLSDISLFLTGGVFLPQTGNAMKSDAPARWYLCAGTALSF